MKDLILLGCTVVIGVAGLAITGVLRREDVKLAYYSRVPLISALALILIGPISIYSPLRHLLANAFLAYGYGHLAMTTAICILAGFLFASIYRNIEYNGRERFLGIPLDLIQSLLDQDGAMRSDVVTDTDVQFKEKNMPVETVARTVANRSLQGGSRVFALVNRFMQVLQGFVFESFAEPNCWGRLRNHWHILFALAVGLSAPFCMLEHSVEQNAWTHGRPAGWMAIVLGLVLAFFLLLLSSYLSNKFVPTTLQIPGMNGFEPNHLFGRIQPSQRTIAFGSAWAKWFRGYGYASEDPRAPGRYLMHPGHVQLTISTIVMGVLYIFIYWWSVSAAPHSKHDNVLPTIGYVVFVVSFVTSIVAFLTFLLDYYHVPSTLAGAAMLILIYSLPTHTPASFKPIRTQTAQIAPPKLLDVLSQRIAKAQANWPAKDDHDEGKPGRKMRVMIVVTAPGGGIHAAAWTARVLTGLHELYGAPFDDSLGMISGISGGGMGAWIFVDALARNDVLAIPEANKIAQASSLDAVAWGLAFPDLIRAVNPLPWSPDDRGRVLEKTWEHRLANWNPKHSASRCRTLGDLAKRSLAGEIPAIAWTTTDVVTGKRVVIAPLADGVGAADSTVNLYYELSRLGGSNHAYDLWAATATRLAATFPYVTPIVGLDRAVMSADHYDSDATKNTAQMLSELRCIDGGYFDNEGLVTAVNCITSFLKDLVASDCDPQPIDKILLLRIEPSPPTPAAAVEARLAADNSGLDLVMSAVGPLLALANVRSASQAERGNLEAVLLVNASIDGAKQAKQKAAEMEKVWAESGLSPKDFEKLWSEDWKAQLFGDHVAGDDQAKTNQIVSTAIKLGHAEKTSAYRAETSLLSATANEAAKEALEWWSSQSVGIEHSLNDVTNQLASLKDETVGHGFESKIYPLVENLRGVTRAEKVRQITIQQTTIPFYTDQSAPPLSWALSPREMKNYDAAWQSVVENRRKVAVDQNPLIILDTMFVRSKH